MKIAFEGVRKEFATLRGKSTALRDVNLSVDDGEFFVILGPSGCGKSTLLNLAAGLEKPSGGVIRFDDRVVAAPGRGAFIGTRERNIAMVFQSYALYPHLTVFDNIAFPLRIAGRARAEIQPAVAETAEKLGIRRLLERKPAELSGGQRQRVAIARAIIRRPAAFLLDEPLSNLDAQLRSRMRVELKRLQRELGVTTLYVTHDQTEAMTLGDRIGLFKEGVLVQTGTPEELYAHPRTPFAAAFIGSPQMNLVAGRLEESTGEPAVRLFGVVLPLPGAAAAGLSPGAVQVGIRPEHVRICSEEESGAVEGRVAAVESLGRETLLHIERGDDQLAVLTGRSGLRAGDLVRVCIDPERLHLFPPV